MKTKQQLLYTLTHTGGRYHHVKVTVAWRDNGDHSVLFTLQANGPAEKTSSDPVEGLRYYGLRWEVAGEYVDWRTEETLATVKRVVGAVHKAAGLTAGGSDPCELKQVRAGLAALRAVHAVYDRRTMKHEPVATLAPPDHAAWRDDWQVMQRHQGCQWGCLAPTPEQARAKIMAEAAADIADRPDCSAAGYFAKWVEAGLPVLRLDADAPTVTTWDQCYSV